MNVKQWLASTAPNERRIVCDAAGTSPVYLFQLSGGHRTPSVSLTKKLVRASAIHTPDRTLSLKGLRPDVWGTVA